MSAKRRYISDERLEQFYSHCPDDNYLMIPIGRMQSADESLEPYMWRVGFSCPLHHTETIYVWKPEFDEMIQEVLVGVDLATVPLE